MADSGTGGRADGRLERGDGTTGGVALPLLAAALVCLLATSGVWLFSNTGEDEKRNDTTIGLNVPTGGVNVPPNMGSENMTGPQASGTAAPSKSATGPKAGSQSPSKVGVKSPSAKETSPTSQTPGTSTSPTTLPPTSQAPTSAPASPAPSPPASPPPPTIQESGKAEKSWGIVKLTVTVTYPPGTPPGSWVLVLTSADSWQCDDHGSGVAQCDGRKKAKGSGAARITFTFSGFGVDDEVSYTFNGATKTVPIP